MIFTRKNEYGIIFDRDEIDEIEKEIGHEFRNKKLLHQAFTRRSYAEEHGGEDNEVLEFAGDKVLDIIVTKLLLEEYGSKTQNGGIYTNSISIIPCNGYNQNGFSVKNGIDEGVLTEKRKRFVNGKNLADCIEDLELNKYLIMGKGERKNHAERRQSVKEDLFEAILGAVAIDSNWDFEELEKVVDEMLKITDFLESDFTDEEENYFALLQQWHQKEFDGEVANYNVTDWGDGYRATVKFSSDFSYNLITRFYHPLFQGYGKSKREAKEEAAQEAYEWLEENDMLFSEKDIVTESNLTPENAINKLQELAQHGFCSEPSYEFYESNYEDGRAYWPCMCSVERWGSDRSRKKNASWSSKKLSKKFAAFGLICEHYGWKEFKSDYEEKYNSSDGD